MNTLKPRIASLLQQLNERVFEKEHIVALALLSAVAGESIFLLGPPGVAKSMVGRRLKLAFRNASAFEYLMSRFSTPDEIFCCSYAPYYFEAIMLRYPEYLEMKEV